MVFSSLRSVCPVSKLDLVRNDTCPNVSGCCQARHRKAALEQHKLALQPHVLNSELFPIEFYYRYTDTTRGIIVLPMDIIMTHPNLVIVAKHALRIRSPCGGSQMPGSWLLNHTVEKGQLQLKSHQVLTDARPDWTDSIIASRCMARLRSCLCI